MMVLRIIKEAAEIDDTVEGVCACVHLLFCVCMGESKHIKVTRRNLDDTTADDEVKQMVLQTDRQSACSLFQRCTNYILGQYN